MNTTFNLKRFLPIGEIQEARNRKTLVMECRCRSGDLYSLYDV